MSDIKMSDEDVSYALQYLSGFEPEDIECDDFDIAVNDDQFASLSIVRAAKLGHESIDRLVEENAQLKADKAELLEMLSTFIPANDYQEYDSDGEWSEINYAGEFMYDDDSEHIGLEVVALIQKHKEPDND